MEDNQIVFTSGRSVRVIRGGNISIRNRRITVNGKPLSEADGEDLKEVKLIISGGGEVGCIDSDNTIQVDKGVTINGSLNAGGSITCGNVNGSANAGGSVTCGDVRGNASAGGTVRCTSARSVRDSSHF
jgi:hypothetical protein